VPLGTVIVVDRVWRVGGVFPVSVIPFGMEREGEEKFSRSPVRTRLKSRVRACFGCVRDLRPGCGRARRTDPGLVGHVGVRNILEAENRLSPDQG